MLVAWKSSLDSVNHSRHLVLIFSVSYMKLFGFTHVYDLPPSFFVSILWLPTALSSCPTLCPALAWPRPTVPRRWVEVGGSAGSGSLGTRVSLCALSVWEPRQGHTHGAVFGCAWAGVTAVQKRYFSAIFGPHAFVFFRLCHLQISVVDFVSMLEQLSWNDIKECLVTQLPIIALNAMLKLLCVVVEWSGVK